TEGSVIGFSGDAIMCWFDRDDGKRAVGCAARLHRAMARFESGAHPLAIKVAVAAGQTRRFVVGDPQLHVLDVLTGAPLDRVARAEALARPGEVIASAEIAAVVGERAVSEWRSDGDRFAVIGAIEELSRRSLPASSQ